MLLRYLQKSLSLCCGVKNALHSAASVLWLWQPLDRQSFVAFGMFRSGGLHCLSSTTGLHSTPRYLLLQNCAPLIKFNDLCDAASLDVLSGSFSVCACFAVLFFLFWKSPFDVRMPRSNFVFSVVGTGPKRISRKKHKDGIRKPVTWLTCCVRASQLMFVGRAITVRLISVTCC